MDILMHHYIKKFFNEFVGEYPVLFFIAVIIIIVVIGTIAFHIVEGWNLFNSFYFTTVTMSTIGYGDMAPLTHGGKVIAIIYGFM
jgi:voltage-gated potassium channel